MAMHMHSRLKKSSINKLGKIYLKIIIIFQNSLKINNLLYTLSDIEWYIFSSLQQYLKLKTGAIRKKSYTELQVTALRFRFWINFKNVCFENKSQRWLRKTIL